MKHLQNGQTARETKCIGKRLTSVVYCRGVLYITLRIRSANINP